MFYTVFYNEIIYHSQCYLAKHIIASKRVSNECNTHQSYSSSTHQLSIYLCQEWLRSLICVPHTLQFHSLSGGEEARREGRGEGGGDERRGRTRQGEEDARNLGGRLQLYRYPVSCVWYYGIYHALCQTSSTPVPDCGPLSQSKLRLRSLKVGTRRQCILSVHTWYFTIVQTQSREVIPISTYPGSTHNSVHPAS